LCFMIGQKLSTVLNITGLVVHRNYPEYEFRTNSKHFLALQPN